ncbi:hypothetical protein THIAE_07290 [Thiomicrospira aerophila AL3]|uniref:6-hydroxymethylpterin diphosphokinase MptE-like domain-containing protein n=1 Tax=Thiomicrospira aerophila AL3 TaxID=717772 RepID=W0DUQ8_9GAMM|nr:hypothetical protein THIAE_07290 [Thiomicrospira aerophila AL3]
MYDYFKKSNRKKDKVFIFFEFTRVVDKLNLKNNLGFDKKNQIGLFLIEGEFSFSDYLPEALIVQNLVSISSTLKKYSNIIDVEYDEFRKKILAAYNVYASSLILATKKKDFENQAIRNLSHNILPAKFLKSKFKNKVALILGGGPSLDDTVEWVKLNRNKLFIFAAGRIANRLIKEGITPDFIGSIDPYQVSFDNAKTFLKFADKDSFIRTPVLINAYHVNNDLLSQWGGNSVYLGASSALLNDDNISLFGPTVAHALVGAAIEFGFKYIYFAGIDLCFTDGKTHESMSEEVQSDGIASYGEEFTLINNLGEKSTTHREFYKGHQSLTQMVNFYLIKQPGLKFFSLGAKSAAINKVNYVELDKVILKEEIWFDVNVFFSHVDLSVIINIVEKKIPIISNLIKRFKLYEDLAQKTLKNYESKSLSKNYFFSEQDFKALNSAHQVLKNKMGGDLDYLVSLDISLFQGVFLSSENRHSLESRMAAFQTWFNSIYLLANFVVRLLELSLDRLALRISELSFMVEGKPSFDAVKAVWEEIDQTGRVMFVSNFATKSVEKDVQEKIDKLKNNFLVSLGVSNRVNELRVLGNSDEALWQSLLTAYKISDVAALNKVIDLSSANTAQLGICLIAKALVAKINGNLEQSVDLLKEALSIDADGHIRFCLDELLKISIARDDLNSALSYVEQLCQFSLEYMKTYAKLLKLLGNLAASSEVLAMYVSVYKDDLGARITLAEQYHDLGMVAEAEACVDQVLAVEANHKAALHYKKVWFSH